MPYDILLKLAFSSLLHLSSSLSYSLTQQAAHDHIFEVYTFGCVSIRALELLIQVLWLLKFPQKKFCCSHLHVRSAIVQFSQSLIIFVCVSHETIFDILINILRSFARF